MNVSRKGFTLIELLTVISIILVLAALLTTGLVEARKKAKISKAKEEAGELAKAWKTYWAVYGKWPPSLGIPKSGGMVSRDMDVATLAILQGGKTPGTGGSIDPDNPQNINFLQLGTNDLTTTHDFVDPWGKTYKVYFYPDSSKLGGAVVETVVSMPNRRRYENE